MNSFKTIATKFNIEKIADIKNLPLHILCDICDELKINRSGNKIEIIDRINIYFNKYLRPDMSQLKTEILEYSPNTYNMSISLGITTEELLEEIRLRDKDFNLHKSLAAHYKNLIMKEYILQKDAYKLFRLLYNHRLHLTLRYEGPLGIDNKTSIFKSYCHIDDDDIQNKVKEEMLAILKNYNVTDIDDRFYMIDDINGKFYRDFIICIDLFLPECPYDAEQVQIHEYNTHKLLN